jgi:hypothetical protein
LLAAFDAATGGPLAETGLGPTAETVGTWLLLAGMALAVVSGVDYVARAWPVLTGTRPT